MPPTGATLEPPIIGNAPLLRAVKAAVARTGVRVLDAEVVTLLPQTDVAALRPYLDAAAEIGTEFVQVVSEDADRARTTERFAALCDEASGFGLKVAIEFMRKREVRTIEDAAEVVTGAARANGGVVLDALHLSRSGGTPASVTKAGPALVAYAQLCDAPAAIPSLPEIIAEARTGRLFPGEGELPVMELLDVLPESVPLSIEVANRAHAGLGVREKAALAGAAARRFLDAYAAQRAGSAPRAGAAD